MDVHHNARTTRHSRMLMVQRLAGGWTVAAVAAAQGVTAKTVRKWRDRYAAVGTEEVLPDSRMTPARPDQARPDAERAGGRRARGSADISLFKAGDTAGA